jgi:hypothetical protein
MLKCREGNFSGGGGRESQRENEAMDRIKEKESANARVQVGLLPAEHFQLLAFLKQLVIRHPLTQGFERKIPAIRIVRYDRLNQHT